ncbi:hypothetical protein SAMN05660473_00714 [Arthrobacter sp. 49Tsu3.1M3]|uniref:hypothetical protein n=1 Tax=Arthrobacter sp. 49Tsu3.1M3 TaxID=1279029 RepID=UPI0009C8AD1E|nr:hypothetical protein [Arthrobacter sp. 49Tsu3.1M3]SKB44149.1 hypothetical protein SAMN05660473_00714 [Arthrobacter sp. 49Tsu3.1M3]
MVALNDETEWNIARQGHGEPVKVVPSDKNTAGSVGKAFGASNCDRCVQPFVQLTLIVDAEISNNLICIQLVDSHRDGFQSCSAGEEETSSDKTRISRLTRGLRLVAGFGNVSRYS